MLNAVVRGRVWKFGDNINTDIIYSGKYLSITDPSQTAQHAFETTYPNFAKETKPGDIIVAGKYFGCGSSREQAAACLKYLGIGCIVAESFARIYYRNAINLGLPIVISPGITKRVEEGHILEVNPSKGSIKNISTGEEIDAIPLPDFILKILASGGLIPDLKKQLKST